MVRWVLFETSNFSLQPPDSVPINEFPRQEAIALWGLVG